MIRKQASNSAYIGGSMTRPTLTVMRTDSYLPEPDETCLHLAWLDEDSRQVGESFSLSADDMLMLVGMAYWQGENYNIGYRLRQWIDDRPTKST